MIHQHRLEALEARVGTVLDGGPMIGLDVLGYGEISTVLRAAGVRGPVAVKRLPVMSTRGLDSYRTVLGDYVATLERRGVVTVATEVIGVGEDPIVPYCVQPLQPRLLVDELRGADVAAQRRYLDRLVARVAGAVDAQVGLDGQISNWAVVGDELVYFDVTTPLLRDDSGRERLDTDVFIASLPAALRGPVRRFMLGEILSHYYDPRAVLLDAAGNLHKERLPEAIEPLLAAAAAVAEPAITVDEAGRYYRSDARMWALLQRLRRADRWWQRTVRRRRYPFLLPGEIER
jgi:hypothetical protein